MSITPVSALKMRRAGCKKDLPDPCARDIRKNGGTMGGLRSVQGKTFYGLSRPFSGGLTQFLPRYVGQVMFLAIGYLVAPHDEDNF